MAFSTTPELKAARNILAPLLAAELINYNQVEEIVNFPIPYKTMQMWVHRERKKPLDKQSRRLKAAQKRIELDFAGIVRSAAPTIEVKATSAAPTIEVEATSAAPTIRAIEVCAAQSHAESFGEYRSRSMDRLIAELDQLHYETTAKLQEEFKDLNDLSAHLMASLQSPSTKEVVTAIQGYDKLLEMRRKLAILPYDTLDINKSLPTQHLAVNIAANGAQGYNPRKVNNSE
jgi:hypothetical protein